MGRNFPIRGVAFWAVLAWAVTMFVWWGCAPKRVSAPIQVPSPDEVIHKIQRSAGIKALRAWGSSKWRGHHQKGSADIAIILQRPHKLRLEGLSPFGSSLYSLVLREEQIALFVPSEKRFYMGAASPKMMERFFSLPLRAEEVLGVLIGKVPLCPGKNRRIYQQGDRLVLEISCERDGWLQKISLDPIQMEPRGFRLQDPSGAEVLVVKWRDFERQGDARIPTEIHVEMPTKGRQLRLRLDEWEINPDLTEENFQLIIPSDVEVQPLSS